MKQEINAFLGAHTTYEGKLTFQGEVRVDGNFTGEITSDGSLSAGKDSKIEGRLEVGELVLMGKFVGEVHAKRRIVVKKGGRLTGTIVTKALEVEDGAIIDGEICMQEHPAPRNQVEPAETQILKVLE